MEYKLTLADENNIALYTFILDTEYTNDSLCIKNMNDMHLLINRIIQEIDKDMKAK